MSEQPKPSRSLSEISHLFLSSVRDKQTGGAPRPQRVPPSAASPAPQRHNTEDLTPEELAHVMGTAEPAVPDEPVRIAPVRAVIGTHLNGKQFDQAKRYVRHLAAAGRRVGLIEVDACEFRLMVFDADRNGPEAETPECGCFDARLMAESLNELSWDVECWVLLVCNPRPPEARALLREVDRWVLLSTSDHDGIVSCYRALKGLADMHRPRLSLAVLDSRDEAKAQQVYRKLSGVCLQFLTWPLEAESPVRDVHTVAEHLVLCCRATHDKAQLAAATHWQVVLNFLSRAKACAAPDLTHEAAPEPQPMPLPAEPIASEPAAPVAALPQPIAEPVVPVEPMLSTEPQPQTSPPAPPKVEPPAMTVAPAAAAPLAPLAANEDVAEVLELAAGEDADSIVQAVVKHSAGELIECPVRPPACPQAIVGIARDRRLTLLAVTRQGLNELRAVAQAYRWLLENRALVAMAMPQFAIDPAQEPRLRLLVDETDLTADLLRPMLQSDHVTVRAYRRVRWGQKLGLVLATA